MVPKNHALRGFATALRTLTVLPWPGKENEDLASSLFWFPVVGFILGLVLYGIGVLWQALSFEWDEGLAFVMVGAEIWLTRALHLDGLADWADSIGGPAQKERRLEIMKDFRLGTFGALGLAVALLAKWVAFARLISCGSFVWMMPIFAVSRAMMVELITTLDYARPGEGMARPFVQGASPKHRAASHLLCLAACLPFGPPGLICYGIGWLTATVFRARCHRRFGGITGDLLGTCNEMVATGLLLACALPGRLILHYTGWAWL